VSRSGGLLCLEASYVRIFLSGIKTDGATTTGGTRDIIAEVMLR
jgi:hypothetical protein